MFKTLLILAILFAFSFKVFAKDTYWENWCVNEGRILGNYLTASDAAHWGKKHTLDTGHTVKSTEKPRGIGSPPYSANHFCVGQYESSCERGMKWVGCKKDTGYSADDWGRAICGKNKRSTISVVSNRPGNRCGYTVYSVYCYDDSQ